MHWSTVRVLEHEIGWQGGALRNPTLARLAHKCGDPTLARLAHRYSMIRRTSTQLAVFKSLPASKATGIERSIT